MPIRFRCPGCEGLLSIAQRKAGSEILCPKCGEALIVPPPLDSDNEAEPDEAEPEPAPPPKRPEPAGVGAGAKEMRERRRRSNREPDTEMLAPPPELLAELERPSAAPPKPVAHSRPSAPAPKPAPPSEKPREKEKPKLGPNGEPPLFERSDFEQLLNPGAAKSPTGDTAESEASSDGTKPALPTGKPKIAADAMPLGLPVADDGMFITRGAAIMLCVLLFVMLGLAFAVGFLMGT